MTGIIYKYVKKDTQQVVYVGQTTNEAYRRYRHEVYDWQKPSIKEYNYPLSRAFRKYGVDSFDYQQIEVVDIEDLTNREGYWIDYYNTVENGYNQHNDGNAPKYCLFEEELIDEVIELLKHTTLSFQEISEQTGISVVTLSEINTGMRRHCSNEQYPLRELTQGRKFTKSMINDVKDLLINSTLSMNEIARQFNVCPATIRNINIGKRYYNETWDYPLRKK